MTKPPHYRVETNGDPSAIRLFRQTEPGGKFEELERQLDPNFERLPNGAWRAPVASSEGMLFVFYLPPGDDGLSEHFVAISPLEWPSGGIVDFLYIEGHDSAQSAIERANWIQNGVFSP